MAQQTVTTTAPGEQTRRERLKRYLSQSNWITDAWSWFMVLAGKAAEPVLILSVLYSSAKLLPAIQPLLTAQLDAVVFIAQFIALDVGGLSLNKMADQVQETNPTGARNAKRLSYALVGIMIAGVILASLSGLMSQIPQVAGAIDTTLLIARAVLAVLYSRVIHSLKGDDGPQPLNAPHPQPDFQTLIDQALDQWKHDQAQEIANLVEQIDGSLQAKLDQALTHIQAVQADLFRQNVTITELKTQAKLLPEKTSSGRVQAVDSGNAQAVDSGKNSGNALPEKRQIRQATQATQAEQHVLRLVPASASREQMIAEAKRLQSIGLSTYQIGEKLGKSAKTVQSWLSSGKSGQSDTDEMEAING